MSTPMYQSPRARASFRAIPAATKVVELVIRNFGPLVRMAWPLLTLYAVLHLVAVIVTPDVVKLLSGGQGLYQPVVPGAMAAHFLLMGFGSAVFGAISVHWHRFMLLGQEAKGWQRLYLTGTIWRYIGDIVLILSLVGLAGGLMVGVVLILIVPLIEPYGFSSTAFGPLFWVVIFFVPVLVVLVVIERLMVKLPAVALGRRDYGLKDAWADSSGNNLKLAGFSFVLAAITAGAGWLADLSLTLLSQGLHQTSIVVLMCGLIIHLVISWMTSIVSINAHTVLYGVFAEGREI